MWGEKLKAEKLRNQRSGVEQEQGKSRARSQTALSLECAGCGQPRFADLALYWAPGQPAHTP